MTNIIIVNVYEVNNYIIYRKRKIPSLDLIPPGYGWEWCSNWKIDPYYTGFGRKWIRKKICVLTTIPFYKMQEIDLYKDAHGSADLYEYDEYDEENINNQSAISINIPNIPENQSTNIPENTHHTQHIINIDIDTKDTKCPCYYLFQS